MIGPMSKNCIGVRYGRLVVGDQLSKKDPKGRATAYAVCKCDCGGVKTIRTDALRTGETRSCGCINLDFRGYKSCVGEKYGKLLVISHYPYFRCGCLCECGKITFANPADLKRGRHLSCGCLKRDMQCLTAVIRNLRDNLLGRTPPPFGERQRPEYQIWRRAVLARDSGICQLCGGPGNITDHIKRFRDFPELRLEVSNGRCLCADCHRKTPTYGNKKQKV